MTRQGRPRRTGRFGPVERLESRDLKTIAATAPLPNLSVTAGATPAQVNLDTYFKDPDAATAANYAMVDTSLGTVPVLLTPQTTPLTVANFENYVAKGSYTNTVVHRSVPGFIWQAGGYSVSSTGSAVPIATDAAVKNEFGASNVRGTIAMAKLGSDPNSATSQFFFNEADNSSNLDNQNGGFTVFGHVVGDQGLAVMDAVAAVPVPTPGPLASPLDQIPLQNYTSGQPVAQANLVLIKDVHMASELFTAASATPGVATATVQGDNLTITPVAAGTTTIAVEGYGADGTPVAQSFTVTVAPGAGGTTTATTTSTSTSTATTTGAAGASLTGVATTVSTTTATTAASAATSVLTPTARGTLPASVVAGGKAKIQETVALANTSGAATQGTEQVKLLLRSTPINMFGDVQIASTTAKVKLKAGQQAKVKLAVKSLDASVPEGTYHLMVAVTDPDGGTTTVDTGKLLTVKAAAYRTYTV